MSIHSCDAIVVACIDFRFQKYIRTWIDQNLTGKTYDYVGFAGSTKDLATIMKQVDISVKLHHIKKVYLIHHEECGAYGNESSFEKHTLDLNKAKKRIIQVYPELTVFLYYLRLDGKFEVVE